jgi:hypothetical protein
VTARPALKSPSVHVRDDMRTWLPFRYGVVTPLLLAMEIAP